MGQIIEPERFYTQSEVCKAFLVSAKAVCHAVRTKRLRASEIGTSKLFKGEWLLAWIEASEVHPSEVHAGEHDPAYWACLLVLAIQSRNQCKETAAREKLRSLGFDVVRMKDEIPAMIEYCELE